MTDQSSTGGIIQSILINMCITGIWVPGPSLVRKQEQLEHTVFFNLTDIDENAEEMTSPIMNYF